MTDLRLNGRMVNFSKLTFATNDPTRIQVALADLLGDEYRDSHLMVVIDSTERNDLNELLKQVRAFGLQPFAVSDGLLSEQAKIRNMPILAAEKTPQRIKAKTVEESTQNHTIIDKTEVIKPLVSPYVVRTGQNIHATQGDLVLFQGCNRGSECFAADSIHVYGHAQGRLIAGISGNTGAGIFCQNFNPELISIAGTFSLAEDIPSNMRGKSVFVSLSDTNTLVYVNMNEN